MEPWYLSDPQRLIEEKELMDREFPEFQLKFNKKPNCIRWEGKLSVKNSTYLVELEYPQSYPFIQPKIFVYSIKNGEYQQETFANSVHVLNDGSLCLFTWDEGKDSWKYNYTVTESIYKLIDFINLFNSDSIPLEHYSIGFTELNKLNQGIIFPTTHIPNLQSFNHGILGLISLNPMNLRTLFVQEMIIKSQEEKDRTLSFNIGLSLPISFFHLKWFHIPNNLFYLLNQCQEITEFNKILHKEYPNWNEEDFNNPIMFLTENYSVKSSEKVVNSAFCVVKHPKNPMLLGKLQVSFGRWDELYFDRLKELLGDDFRILDNSLICLVGVGSLGSEIAVHLVMAGLKNFLLVDPDILILENLPRHALDIRYLHEYKVVGLKHLLTRRNPKINVECYINSILEPRIPYLILDHAKKVEKKIIFVCSTANLEAEYLLNSISLSNNIPVVYSYCNSRVEMGRILRVVPPKTPCLHCFTEACKRKEIMTFPEDEEVFLKAPYQLGLPGVGLDISEIAASTARMVLQTILETNEAKSIYPKIQWNNILHVIHPIEDIKPGIYPAKLVKDPRCEICGNIKAKSEDLNAVKTLLEELKIGSQNDKKS